MTVSDTRDSMLIVNVEFIEMINYSLIQNDFSLVSNIQLFNETEEPFNDLKIKIYSKSGFIYNYEQEIPVVDAESELIIKNPEINYNYEFFKDINEKLKTHFFVEILDYEGNIVYSKPFKISILSYQHWLGMNIYPQLTCAYILPNDSTIKKYISMAANILKEWTGNPSFDGYQTGIEENVRLQAAAIYAALQKENIAYINPPASFEKFGQKIRYPEEIEKYKNGTCIDLSLLYASCLEAIGIHPLVVFKTGHAFVGFWLKEKNFTEPYITDYASVSKRLSKGTQEIEVLEATAFVNGKDFTFEDSVIIGHRNLINGYDFAGVVDVISGRQYGISPVMTSINSSDFIMKDYGERENITTAPSQVIEHFNDIEYKVDPLEKTDIWSRNLLDLTLRNPMINFKMNQSSLQLMVYDIASLEDELSTFESFKIIEKPEIIKNVESNSICNPKDIKSKYKNMIDADFNENRLRSFLTEYMLEKQLKNIYRKARTNLDENGSNSLFLAVGFLRWNDLGEKYKDGGYFAPIILLPLSIEKKSAGNRYLLELSDEEPQLNVTLVEYLYQKFNVDLRHLINLPKDDKGIDVPLILSAIRKSIMDKEGWDIEEIAVLSNFSFSKFVMWNDLQNRKNEISSNLNVKALIEGNYKIDRDLESINARDIEKNKNLINIGSTVDASQLEAIKASENSSFVLHGPPGTGKSQTITNMIIHNLSQGKKILFVAEKRAALNVVYERLSKLGLENSTLELHSNKTKKTTFLSKLENSIESEIETSDLNLQGKSNSLNKLQNKLSEYVEELHQKRQSGFTLYELIQKYERFKGVDSEISIPNKVIRNLKEGDISKVQETSKIIDSIVKQLKNDINNHPLSKLKIEKYSISKREYYPELVEEIQNTISNINEYGMVETLEDQKQHLETMDILNDYYYHEVLDSQFYKLYKNVPLRKAYSFANSKLLYYRELEAKLLSKYNEEIFNLNVNKLKEDYFEIKSKFGLFKQKKLNIVITHLQNKLKVPKEISNEEFEKDVEEIIELQKARIDLNDINDNLEGSFGNSWKGINTDLEQLSSKIDFAEKHMIFEIPHEDAGRLKNLMALKVNDNETYTKLYQLLKSLTSLVSKLKEDYGYDRNEWHKINLNDLAVDLENSLDGMNDFKNWSLLNEKINSLQTLLSVDFKEEIIHNTTDSLEDRLMKSLTEKLIKYTFINNESLDSFNGFEIEKQIQLLKSKVDDFHELSIINTKNQVAKNLKVKRDDKNCENEFLIIQKAIRSKGRGQSIRSIFNKTANVIQDIFPVMLMSPLSIAQYVDPNFPKFDIVIFDEASQIPTDIAVGAISRGNQCIVVGDPKQMPPTSFFGGNIIDEDNLDIEDLESLLDDCLAANFPEKHLLYHYRSNHESLIHFSNTKYYNSSLKTYPSPDALTSKVSFRNVKGVYKRGNFRNNEKEAKEIVEIIIKHLKSDSGDSIGVVTFNIQQQNLIEDMLNNELVKYKKLDTKNSNAKESIFIKNLENVQGDERDIIVFSTTFGPDENNKMTMNFGPLNNQGGWRRLNVAVTRARKEMMIVSSFDPEEINTSRTKAEGVIGLKLFLEFARNSNTIPPIASNFERDFDNITLSIKDYLKARGYDSVINLGNSELKVDIAVQNPNNSHEFILGILIDGRNYFNGKTSNDRNIIQPGVLENLGWKIFRIWSIDWYEDQELVLDKLILELEKLQSIEV